jgi:hypothetical protein
MSAAPTKTRALGLAGALIAIVVAALFAYADSALARETSWNDPDRVATSIKIDDDSIVIRTESKDGTDPETIEILNDDEDRDEIVWKDKSFIKRSKCGIKARVKWDLSDLSDLGCIDIDRCDDDDIVRFGDDIHIRRGEDVDGDVVAVGGTVRVDGDVSGDVVAVGGRVIVGSRGRVDGDVVAVAGNLVLHDGCEVDGDAVTVGGVIKDDGARVTGDTVTIDFDLW